MIEQDKCIIAVVVLFRPEIARIHGLLKSIIMQVDKVVLIDNTDESNLIIPDSEFESYGEKIEHYRLNNNLGIAKAQNIGIHYAEKSKASHILFLDQDSIVPEGMVKTLLINERELLNSGKKVAVLGPAFKDEKTGKVTGAMLEAHKFDEKVTHCMCLVRKDEKSPYQILSPCGICQERLRYWGEDVQVAVTTEEEKIKFVQLKELQPYHWTKAYPAEELEHWNE